jgi:hypothetical protein
MNHIPKIDLQIQVKDILAKIKGTVVVVCPPNVVREVAQQRVMKLFPKKRAVMEENIKPGNTEIPGDVVLFVHHSICEKLQRRMSKQSVGMLHATAVKYWEILNP